MRWSKKGALELSINAIVVLILAITILGLGIAFIRGQFGALRGQFEQVSGEVKTELINKIRESGELLVFSRGEIDVQTGKKDTVYYGISNTAPQKACFYVVVQCLNAQNPTDPEYCTQDIRLGQLVAGPSKDQIRKKWMSLISPVDINANDVGVYPMTIQISGARKDTYLVEILVALPKAVGEAEGDEEVTCSSVASETVFDTETGEISGEWTVYARKQFYVNLN